ncbi:PAS domain-containing protein [Pseudomonas qingdaonensis]|nr:PAS domain-containing protein [Pseudomonas qingdaonensis]
MYTAQDRRVLDSGRELADQLELHLYFGNQPVWCLTHKLALFDTQGQIVGLAGISRDLQAPQASHPGLIAWRRWMRTFASTSHGP